MHVAKWTIKYYAQDNNIMLSTDIMYVRMYVHMYL